MPRLRIDLCGHVRALVLRLKWGNTMIVEYICYTVADQTRGEELQRAYVIAARQLDAAPECLAYELTTVRGR